MKVYHHDPIQGPGQGLELVAEVCILAPMPQDEALELAFRWTQNIDGSWSRGPTLEAGGRQLPNPDYNPALTRKAPLPVFSGVEYGLRSSMIGDVFECDDGSRWIAATFGFEPFKEA